jgi:hypothetical protein
MLLHCTGQNEHSLSHPPTRTYCLRTRSSLPFQFQRESVDGQSCLFLAVHVAGRKVGCDHRPAPASYPSRSKLRGRAYVHAVSVSKLDGLARRFAVPSAPKDWPPSEICAGCEMAHANVPARDRRVACEWIIAGWDRSKSTLLLDAMWPQPAATCGRDATVRTAIEQPSESAAVDAAPVPAQRGATHSPQRRPCAAHAATVGIP